MENESKRYTPSRDLNKDELRALKRSIKEINKAYRWLVDYEMDAGLSHEIRRRIAAARGVLDEATNFLEDGRSRVMVIPD